MKTFILFMFLNGGPDAGAMSQEFTSRAACMQAGFDRAKRATEQGSYVLSWACYPKARKV